MGRPLVERVNLFLSPVINQFVLCVCLGMAAVRWLEDKGVRGQGFMGRSLLELTVMLLLGNMLLVFCGILLNPGS